MLQTFYVLHAPYPDSSWRGIEKCFTDEPSGGLLLFTSEAEARAYGGGTQPYFVPWPVTVHVPAVGSRRATPVTVED